MKVIAKGIEQPPWSARVQCMGDSPADGDGCCATLEVEFDDLFRVPVKNNPGVHRCCFKCPLCGVVSEMPTLGYPQGWGRLPTQAEFELNQTSKEVPT